MDSHASTIRFSLGEVPERQRSETLTEVFGRGVVNMDFQPLDDRPQVEFEIRLLPGVALTRGFNTPHIGTTGHDLSRENDDLMLAWARRPGKGRLLHRGREILGEDGTAAFASCSERMIGETRTDFHYTNVRLERRLLTPLIGNPEDQLMRPIPGTNEALRLLNAYLEILRASGEPQCPEVAHAVALHIADLVALAVGTAGEAADFAARRGLRAARLASVKRWMLEHIAEPNLSVAAVARAHCISPRYVQLLFEQDGTSFSRWLRSERLALARRRLIDPQLAHRSIASIAFGCGFSDLSWFNRAFRNAYCETPSDVRHAAPFATRH